MSLQTNNEKTKIILIFLLVNVYNIYDRNVITTVSDQYLAKNNVPCYRLIDTHTHTHTQTHTPAQSAWAVPTASLQRGKTPTN